MPEFSHCLIEKMMTYALGRGLEPYDRRAVNQHSDASWRPPDYQFQIADLRSGSQPAVPIPAGRNGDDAGAGKASKTKEIASR